MPLPATRTRLRELFTKINDESLRTIIAAVVGIENEHRSAVHFPIKQIENVVDDEATLVESQRGRDENR